MRKFAWLNLVILLSMLLAACGPTAAPATQAPATDAPKTTDAPKETAAPEETTAPEETAETPASKYSESPMLAEKVTAGELSPVDERLPMNPMVVAPLVEQGQYSDELRYGFTGTNPEWGGMLYLNGWEHLVSWSPDFSEVVPNIVESWEISDDAREYTFHIRKGIKWSDGVPFTADDIMFYVEDVFRDPDISPNPGADWITQAQVPGFVATKVDDYTFKFAFAESNGILLYKLAKWDGRYFTQYPKHYMQQFHKKYNPDVDKLVAEDGVVKDWVALFSKMGAANWGDPGIFFRNVDHPSMSPWVLKQELGTGTTILLERNPYYWKVDPAGNQLPYIDRVTATSFQDDQSRTFAMMNGDLDFIKDPGEPNRELYYQAVDEGKPIRILNPTHDGGNTQSIHFNYNDKDPLKAQIFQDKNFRIGMSYALNREEIIEVIFKGQGEPAQVAPLESSPLYNEQLATQYIEYDVDKANEYLDKVLPDKDSEGFRVRPDDGKRFTILFTAQSDNAEGAHWVQLSEMFVKYWKEVGVDVQLDVVTGAVWDDSRRATNDWDARVFHGAEGGTGITAIIDYRWHVPGDWNGFFCIGWHLWLANENAEEMPELAVEPPDYVKQMYKDYYTKVAASADPAVQIAEMSKLLQQSADNFWLIGISRYPLDYQPISARLHNVPDSWLNGWLQGFTKILYPEQWYIQE